MAELLLSALLPVLFEKLASRDLLDFLRQLQGGVDSELKKWGDTLRMIKAVLTDAEEKELTDEAVKFWLDELRDLAYDAEDTLDEFATEALKHKLEADAKHEPSKNKVQRFLPVACFNCFNPKTVKFNMDVKSKIESLTNRFRELCEKRIVLGLQVTCGGRSTAAIAQNRPPSSSVATERAVYGRNEDKAKIVEMVLNDEPSAINFCVIPIVGMGGVGKTTLAREIYNDEAVQNFKFDIRAWVCVSDNFDVLSISRAILESITSSPCDLKTLNEVQVQLKKVVEKKKFLLVLDDVWNEEYNLWQTLRAPLMACALNSKIIVTTRHANVASIMGSIEQHNLKLVSDEDCWSIFKMHVFEGHEHQVSEAFREKVIGKCGGLPLAATTLGGLLRFKSVDVWNEILTSAIWDFSQHGDILPVLRLSYHYLPAHLKRCFNYSVIFPKDYEFGKEELVLLWMAEGIIQQPKTINIQQEDWGIKCFDDLVSRSIFQQSSGDIFKFVMHDLVHDLGQLASGETILRLEESNKLLRRPEKVRHSSFMSNENDGINKFKLFYKLEHLRTFMPVSMRDNIGPCYISNVVPFDLLPKLKKLRVLSLVGYYITELPDSIKNLILLSYLNLTDSKIRSLPESISSLLNLQILKLRNCVYLTKLPAKMRKLINLRYFDIKGANLLTEMPLGMKELERLYKLSNFIVGEGTGSSLKELKHLKFLCGEFCISGLENVNDPQDAREATMCEKINLETLALEWRSQCSESRDEEVEKIILDALQPHKNIKGLALKNYGGVCFPLWIGDPLFSKMEVLELDNCQNCTSLPSLGLLGSLKKLALTGMKGLRCIGFEIYGKDCSKPFQSLEILQFENLEEWEYWDTDIKENEQVELFPLLRELSIKRCPKLLGKLPKPLPSLETFVVSECEELVVSISSFPMLNRLKIDECKGIQVSSTPIDSELIKLMTISSSSVDMSGCKGMLYNSPIDDLFHTLSISNPLEFSKFFKQGSQMVDTLGIGDCDSATLWGRYGVFFDKEQAQGLHIITGVDEVSIVENRVSLVSFPEVNLPLHNVRSLRIAGSRVIESLPEELMGHNSLLERLFIADCDFLTFIARCKLPPSLQRLEIWSCDNLQHLVVDEEDASSMSSSSMSLKYLAVHACPELTTLSSGMRLLEVIVIGNCPKLELIPDGLRRLKEIYVENCPGLVYLLERGLPNSISVLHIEGCEKLKALPKYMHKLNSLQGLKIGEFSSRVSFPQEGFSNNLRRLTINDGEIYKGLIQWGLHRLTSLTRLTVIGCHDAESFPDEEIGMMLPTSLTFLYLWRLPKLKYLSNSISMGFLHLTSLDYLYIRDCPNLTSFPEVGLPSSLLRINIHDCPKLKEECKRGKGKEWSKISHIPRVEIDWEFIHDPDEAE